jgi:hypothetical protein
MGDVREWAREYRRRGLAVCRIRAGQKRPTYKGWNRFSLEPEGFRPGDSIGLQAGALSGNLVCVDLDHADVLQIADRFLPETGMVEGRVGMPRSHRWYVVKDVPPELTAPRKVAGGLGGPKTKRLKRPDGTSLIDLLGTGSQAVVPASVWVSRDGARREPRQWERLKDSTAVDCGELYDAVGRLAASAGWANVERAPRARRRLSREAPGRLPLPTGEAALQARAHLAKLPPAVEGRGGDHQTYAAACLLVLDCGLSPEAALPLLLEYNERCEPPWTVEGLWHKLTAADAQDRDDRGWRVRPRSYRIVINLGPDGPVYVGLGCAAPGRSSVELSPSLYAGMVKVGEAWELKPELDALNWDGREVVLASASTITTNAREVWGEFFLARLLRERGAHVQSIRLPPLQGRRRTLAMADAEGWAVVDPPRHPWEAKAAADRASEEARRLDGERRRLPRHKDSPKLDKAVAFVKQYGVHNLTKDMLKTAKRKGITTTTLRRALQASKENTQPLTPPHSCVIYPSIWTRPAVPILSTGEDFGVPGQQEAA